MFFFYLDLVGEHSAPMYLLFAPYTDLQAAEGISEFQTSLLWYLVVLLTVNISLRRISVLTCEICVIIAACFIVALGSCYVDIFKESPKSRIIHANITMLIFQQSSLYINMLCSIPDVCIN